MRRTFPGVALFMVTVGGALLAADYWPQWRGPELNGVSKEIGLVHPRGPFFEFQLDAQGKVTGAVLEQQGAQGVQKIPLTRK